ncbi:uncharacterized protein LOC132734559, partial [Ruditapes philippinarum]|uniref:uncharacterized protein LOC132734559 n=1 Tax=Ruditapes philippinarum TaxID=129788 RepID=UPI00295AC8A2
MDFIGILKCLGLVVTIVLLLIGAINIFSRLQRLESMDPSFKQIVKYLFISALVSDTMGLFNLLLSAASGEWPLGFGACENWGFASTTMLAFTAWMITLAVIERYLAILSPSEVPSAFSQRNTQIMAVGMLFLVMMAVTGPFYGFGEYTYLRGYLNVFVFSNISLPLPVSHKEHTDALKLQNLHELFSHLRHSSYSSPRTDMLSLISRHIHQHFDIIVGKAEWLPHGILFSIRATSKKSLETFMEHLNGQFFTQNITDLSFIEDIASTLNISDTALTAHIEMPEFQNYVQKHLPVQDMGICTADITSPSHHVSIWTGFYASTVFILPYCLSLGGL